MWYHIPIADIWGTHLGAAYALARHLLHSGYLGLVRRDEKIYMRGSSCHHTLGFQSPLDMLFVPKKKDIDTSIKTSHWIRARVAG